MAVQLVFKLEITFRSTCSTRKLQRMLGSREKLLTRQRLLSYQNGGREKWKAREPQQTQSNETSERQQVNIAKSYTMCLPKSSRRSSNDLGSGGQSGGKASERWGD